MTEEMQEVKTDSAETDKKVEEVFEVLFAQPINELRNLYEKEFNVALKGKDKQKIAIRLAKKIVAKGEPFDVKGSKGNGKSNGTKTAATPAAKPEGLTPEQSHQILEKARVAFVKVDVLKAEKREELRGIKENIDKSREKMTEILRDDGDSDVRLEKLEATWARFSKLENKKAKVSKDYSEKIKDASQALRDTFMSLRQPSLPFDGDDNE